MRSNGRLSDKAIRAFVADGKLGGKLSDGGGLYLHLTAAGGAVWRVKYRLHGKEKLYSIGAYPLIPLASARLEHDEVKLLIRRGVDPVMHRRIARVESAASANATLLSVSEEWLKMKKREWSAGHFIKSVRAFERDIYPSLGRLPVASITPALVAAAIQAIQKRGVQETASRILQHLAGVFRYAQAKGLCRDNPAIPAREVLPRKKNTTHMPALLNFKELGEILRRAQIARISPAVHQAHRLCAFTAARIGNVIGAQWSEFDLDGELPVWTIPRAKMKVTSRVLDHRIPLGMEIAEELRRWRALIGNRGYLFPSPSGRDNISRESIEKMYRETLRLGGRHSPHGWRSAFSTLSREYGFERDVVELALDHVHDDEVARAYDRGERFSRRIELYRWWGQQLYAAQILTK